jgi:hypothetical protein
MRTYEPAYLAASFLFFVVSVCCFEIAAFRYNVSLACTVREVPSRSAVVLVICSGIWTGIASFKAKLA